MGGGQQPDRGNLSNPTAAANHFFPPTPSLAHQRLCQSGMKARPGRSRSSSRTFFESLRVCLSGDGCGRSL